MSSESLPPPRRRWLHVLLGVVLLLCGAIIGASVTVGYLYDRVMMTIHEPEKLPARIVSRMRWKYGLDDAQAQKIEAIYNRSQEELSALRDKGIPEFEAILQRAQQDVSAILTPEQAERYNENFNHLRERLIPKR